MQIQMLKSKIFQATVTDAREDYEGSITIASNIMEAAGLMDHEKVLISNFSNGARFETYVIPAKAGSGKICINGAATRLAGVGDEVIVMSFCALTPDEARDHHPKVIRLDKSNRIVNTKTTHAPH